MDLRPMVRLKAGIDKFRQKTEQAAQVGDHLIRHAFTAADGAHHVKEKFIHKRQYTIRGRTVEEVKQISEGGFAYVWKARDVSTHEEFALKKILCQDKAGLAMARREVELLERLPSHHHIVGYYGSTITQMENGKTNEVCLLFELCPGGHLLDLLDRNKGKLSEKQIVSVFGEIVTAVVVLHAQSPPIQHRDLKVENVLMGKDKKWKLCDFGSWSDQRSDVAKLDKQELSMLQEHIDRYTTMMYRPPEMVDFFQQFPISEKVDVWMLGCILFTLMFCRHPFQDESSLAIANARYHLSSSPKYSEKLQDLVHWLLARDPADRPSAFLLLEILARFDGEGGSLPLPAAVIARRDKDRRLYDENGAVAPKLRDGIRVSVSGSASPRRPPSIADSPMESRRTERSERRHHRSKKDKGASASSGAFDDVWAKPFDMDAACAWPQAPTPTGPGAGDSSARSGAGGGTAPPEPSRSWAAFGDTSAFGHVADGDGHCAAAATAPTPWSEGLAPAPEWPTVEASRGGGGPRSDRSEGSVRSNSDMWASPQVQQRHLAQEGGGGGGFWSLAAPFGRSPSQGTAGGAAAGSGSGANGCSGEWVAFAPVAGVATWPTMDSTSAPSASSASPAAAGWADKFGAAPTEQQPRRSENRRRQHWPPEDGSPSRSPMLSTGMEPSAGSSPAAARGSGSPAAAQASSGRPSSTSADASRLRREATPESAPPFRGGAGEDEGEAAGGTREAWSPWATEPSPASRPPGIAVWPPFDGDAAWPSPAASSSANAATSRASSAARGSAKAPLLSARAAPTSCAGLVAAARQLASRGPRSSGLGSSSESLESSPSRRNREASLPRDSLGAACSFRSERETDRSPVNLRSSRGSPAATPASRVHSPVSKEEVDAANTRLLDLIEGDAPAIG